MSYKTERDLHRMLRHQELIESSLSFVSGSEDFIRDNDIFPSGRTETDVMRGLRYPNGTGVVAGVTSIGDVDGYDLKDGKKIPRKGRLFYRGVSIEDLIQSCIREDRFGFEETVYLLLFGQLPTLSQLEDFQVLMARWSQLPGYFSEDMILRSPNKNIMNKLASCILALHSHDGEAENRSLENELFKSFRMVARTPTIVAHSYAAKRHYFDKDSLYLHRPRTDLSVAQNFLYTLRKDSKFDDDEAKLLDLCMILHAEHGGGNNSTFACRVLTSTGTDFYSSIAAAVGSLKGFRHGGANIKVVEMMQYLRNAVRDWKDDGQVKDQLVRILNRELGDGTGLIYGMGHAVYTLSDPRAEILKQFSRHLAEKRGMVDQLDFIESVERLAPQVFQEVRGIDKPICANVDLYSGFVYRLLGIPTDLYTAIFASARMAGWCAHRMEECCSDDPRIIRPAYKTICKRGAYVPLADRS
ncbi:citrate synthase [Oscillibacter sp.]|jgi:citrate synthase|uniref:citrate synthase n=1 Tax=Oscillibacter sp. TaxID=1945593 RepID=UPI002172761F|nr:citrate synthase [Oscillibacter sp.]MCI9240285.1 citrate synthase [Oscillibacter sp.]MCI9300573.1 citrate synthase [Oscillibacter sp.]MCI9460625.1 citrate synthase [Oscillibacter sp.]